MSAFSHLQAGMNKPVHGGPARPADGFIAIKKNIL